MTYLVAAYGAALLILGAYAVHLARSLRQARRWFDGPESPASAQRRWAGR